MPFISVGKENTKDIEITTRTERVRRKKYQT